MFMAVLKLNRYGKRDKRMGSRKSRITEKKLGGEGVTNKFSKTSLLERSKGSDGDLYIKTSLSNFIDIQSDYGCIFLMPQVICTVHI